MNGVNFTPSSLFLVSRFLRCGRMQKYLCIYIRVGDWLRLRKLNHIWLPQLLFMHAASNLRSSQTTQNSTSPCLWPFPPELAEEISECLQIWNSWSAWIGSSCLEMTIGVILLLQCKQKRHRASSIRLLQCWLTCQECLCCIFKNRNVNLPH